MIYCSHSGGPYEGMYLDVLQFWDTLWLWLTVRHGISMAHRNRWFTVFKNGGSFHGELLVITRWYIEGMGLPQGCHPSFLRERRGENSEARNPEKRFLWSFLQWWNGDFPRRKKTRHLFCVFEEKSRWFRSSLSWGFTQPSYVSAVLGFLKLAQPQILQTMKRLRVGKQIVEVVKYPAQGNTAFKGTLHGS